MSNRKLALVARWYLAGLISDKEFLGYIKRIQAIERGLVLN